MPKTVIGLMEDLGEAQAAVKDLLASGIAREDIGFMANERHAGPPGAEPRPQADSEPAGTLARAGAGAAVGGVAGLGLALSTLGIPGIGPVVAAGVLAGGLIGALTGLGVREEAAHAYAEGVRRGGILVTVAAAGEREAEKAVGIFRRHGAVDIDQRATEWKKQGWKGRFETIR